MSSRWTGFFIWALVAASTAFWGIKIFAATRPLPSGVQVPRAVPSNGPMERLFGAVVVPAEPVAPVHPESERFQLVGVISPPGGGTQGGYAVVAIDGQPARTWHVGATLDGNTSLLSVSKRGAEFGPQGGPTAFTLQLPEPAAAETGSLAPAVSQPVPGVPQPVVAGTGQNPQVENAQHVAQPQMPGADGMPGRGGTQRRLGRAAFQQGQIPPGMMPNGVAPPRMGTPPEQPDGNASQQQ